MSDELAFRRAIDAEPDNPTHRLVFADWLDELGDWRAWAYRWMGTERKWPHAIRDCDTVFFHTGQTGHFGWYHHDIWFEASAFWLPFKLDRLHGPMTRRGRWFIFRTLELAELAVCRAIAERQGVEYPPHVPGGGRKRRQRGQRNDAPRRPKKIRKIPPGSIDIRFTDGKL